LIQRFSVPAPSRNSCRVRRVEFFVDSGWRSAEYQTRLLQQAILKYGSREEAGRWVATANTSAHVFGRGGRHWALRCRSVAVRAGRQVRAVPDLQQRILALRTSPRSHRSRLPAHVRRPCARPKDAAVINNRPAREPMSAQFRDAERTREEHCGRCPTLASSARATFPNAGPLGWPLVGPKSLLRG
jgi:hypothetical protein